MSAQADMVVSRLESVVKIKKGWLGKCPAHKDKTRSLSVGVGNNGGVLLNCFAGCSVYDVASALGLSMSDLFPDKTGQMSGTEVRESMRQARWAAALNVLAFEAKVVQIAARTPPVTKEDLARLSLAVQRIDDAATILGAKR